MFPFITCTRNPIGGGAKNGYWCEFNCSYCYATDMKDYYNWDKYHGKHRLINKELKRKFKEDDFPFLCNMIDIGDSRIPKEVLHAFFDWIKSLSCDNVLLLTKNPYVYIEFSYLIPINVVLGVTIETDLGITIKYSKAPLPDYRLICMEKLKDILPNNKRFISIEPIMKFSPTFIKDIANINPWAVAIGYDNWHNELPEPTLKDTLELIKQLEEFTIVYRKTIRRRWRLY